MNTGWECLDILHVQKPQACRAFRFSKQFEQIYACFCALQCHSAYRGSSSIAPFVLNLSTRRSGRSHTLTAFTPKKNSEHLNRRLGCLWAGMQFLSMGRSLLPLLGIETRFFGHSARRPVSIPTEPTQLAPSHHQRTSVASVAGASV